MEANRDKSRDVPDVLFSVTLSQAQPEKTTTAAKTALKCQQKTRQLWEWCCEDQVYNIFTEMCCNGVVDVKRGLLPSCCNTQVHDLATTICCNGALCLREPLKL
uniref:Galaxin-like repeats domain-containing protein n=1 Tax=Romanomermis culicivorax TaxID=13658 RepID=A0A915IJ85_ROMCU